VSEGYDTNFSLPSVDDDPGTEIGVLLMALGPERLLAGLGVAARGLAHDPAEATLVVDQLRHGVRIDLSFGDALVAGAARWRTAGEGFAAVRFGTGTPSAALRQLLASAEAELADAAEAAPELRTIGAAERVYLIACWLRRVEITRIAEENVVLPELAP